MSYNGLSDWRPFNSEALTCLYCGRTPTGKYNNCDYCGAAIRRGMRIDITAVGDSKPRYLEVEG